MVSAIGARREINGMHRAIASHLTRIDESLVNLSSNHMQSTGASSARFNESSNMAPLDDYIQQLDRPVASSNKVNIKLLALSLKRFHLLISPRFGSSVPRILN
jgi:hypothetical protein